jgi:hypothetical protein
VWTLLGLFEGVGLVVVLLESAMRCDAMRSQGTFWQKLKVTFAQG